MEIAFMTLGVLCGIMPKPFPILVPIFIGAVRIISSAVKREKEPPPQPAVVYCNGNTKPHVAVKRTTTDMVIKAKPTTQLKSINTPTKMKKV